MHSFVLYDQLIDELRYTQRFSVHNALKKLKPNPNFRYNFAITKVSGHLVSFLSGQCYLDFKPIFPAKIKDQYYFCYCLPLTTFLVQNDIRLDQMENSLKSVMTVGKISKRAILFDQLDVSCCLSATDL